MFLNVKDTFLFTGSIILQPVLFVLSFPIINNQYIINQTVFHAVSKLPIKLLCVKYSPYSVCME